MKNFQNYCAPKYQTDAYQRLEDGIYCTKGDDGNLFVTSLTFEMEPECFGEEEGCPQYITQIPLEGLLDEFWVHVSDFYEELNQNSEKTCYLEFASSSPDNIRCLRTLIGKRLIAVPCEEDEEEEEGAWEVVIE